MIDEKWKDIAGYEGLYQISSLGRVRSQDRTTPDGRKIFGKMLKVVGRTMKGKVYAAVNLSRDNHKRSHSVAKLVAENFVSSDAIISALRWSHKDNNRLNNRLTNLMVGDHIGEKNPSHKLTELQVNEIRTAILRGERRKKLASLYQVSPKTIDAIRRGEIWSHLLQSSIQ